MNRPARNAAQGFTLLEIMIVVLLLGVLAGSVVYNMAPPRDEHLAQDAAVVFREKMQHARETALLRNWVIGVEVDEQSYRFYRWQQGQWQLIATAPLQETYVDEALALELQLGDFSILDNIIDGDRSAVFVTPREDDEQPPQPELLIFESTDFVPFQLNIFSRFQGRPYWVDGNDGLHLQLTAEES